MSTAVLAVHYQNDMVHPDGRLGASASNRDLVGNATRLLEGARSARVPVVSVRLAFSPDGVTANAPIFERAVEREAVIEGSWGAEFHEPLRPRDGEPVITHTRINAFHESSLEALLCELGAQRLVVAGVATHSSVEHTARHATDLGYDVLVAFDACASPNKALHLAALRVLRPHVRQVVSVDDVLETVRG